MTTKAHGTPCGDLESLTKSVTANNIAMRWLIGAQFTVILLAFYFSLNAMNSVSLVQQRQIEFSEKQKMMEKKTDDALAKANSAVAMSAKTEANIEWIRSTGTEHGRMLLDTRSMLIKYLQINKGK